MWRREPEKKNKKQNFYFLKLSLSLCVRACVWGEGGRIGAHRSRGHPSPLELTGGCELSDAGSRNQTQVLVQE